MSELMKCQRCPKMLPPESFKLKSTGKRNVCCDECCVKSAASFQKSNDKQGRKYYKMTVERQQRDRRYVLHRYGAVCKCCGEDNPRFLTLDHVKQDGAEHRRQIKGENSKMKGRGSAHGIVAWIIKNNFPPSIQILCFNCNCAKGANRSCPHEEFDWMTMAGLGLPKKEAA